MKKRLCRVITVLATQTSIRLALDDCSNFSVISIKCSPIALFFLRDCWGDEGGDVAGIRRVSFDLVILRIRTHGALV